MAEKPDVRELFVTGTPRSLQSTRRGIERWKARIVDAAERHLGDETFAIQWVDVSVQILHLCPEWGLTDGDLDNIAKPILDALCDSHRVLFNDGQVKELLLRRVEWRRMGLSQIANASPLLASALDAAMREEGPDEFVYIRVSTELDLETLP